jgi:hypothetical protein
MERLICHDFTDRMAQTNHTHGPSLDLVTRAIGRRSFCMLATASAATRPHAAAVLYAPVDTTLYVSTLRTSRKARNIAANPQVAVTIPVRRLPVGPPSSIQFQGRADILAADDPHVTGLVEAGRLRAITGHGELDEPDGCILRIAPVRRITTYGLGMPLRRLLRDPLHAGGSVDLPGTAPAP